MARQHQGTSAEAVSAVISAEVDYLAETFRVGAEHVKPCLEKLVHTFAPHVGPEELAYQLRLFPLCLLAAALEVCPADVALGWVNDEDPRALARRVRLTEYLTEEATPLYTLRDLVLL